MDKAGAASLPLKDLDSVRMGFISDAVPTDPEPFPRHFGTFLQSPQLSQKRRYGICKNPARRVMGRPYPMVGWT